MFDNQSQYDEAAGKIGAYDLIRAAADAFLSACNAEIVAGHFHEADLSDAKGLLDDALSDLYGDQIARLKADTEALDGYSFSDIHGR